MGNLAGGREIISQFCMILTGGNLSKMAQGTGPWHLLESLPPSRSISEISSLKDSMRAHRKVLRKKVLAN